MINLEFPTLNLKETGNRIKTLRVNSGYSVEEIAEYMGFSGPQAVYKWEWGKSLPTVDNLFALSKLFGVAIEGILAENGEFVCFMGKCKLRLMLSCSEINIDKAQKRIQSYYYEGLSLAEAVKHLTKFASDIWQIHPFCEGNTRATAVFMIKYMKSFGMDINNDAFENHSWYFRNALVRAN